MQARTPSLIDIALQPIRERFYSHVKKTDSCWIWTGCEASIGYGQFAIRYPNGKKKMRAHRAAWELEHGRNVPNGMCVLHRCDNRRCVNPEHLWLGTLAENNTDRSRKGRNAVGSRNGLSKLSEKQARQIRDLCDAGWLQKDIAPAFGTHPNTISYIARRLTWRHLDDEEVAHA